MTAALILAAVLAGGPTPAVPARVAGVAADDPALLRAHQAAVELTGELLGRMRTELDAGGPARAVAVCSEIAPAMAGKLSHDGLTIHRVGTRVRNPANTPDAFEANILARWQEAISRGGAPREETLWVDSNGARTLRVMRPITTGRVCLACHGKADGLDPAVRTVLTERYPADRATGYREGDLRGAVSVTVIP